MILFKWNELYWLLCLACLLCYEFISRAAFVLHHIGERGDKNKAFGFRSPVIIGWVRADGEGNSRACDYFLVNEAHEPWLASREKKLRSTLSSTRLGWILSMLVEWSCSSKEARGLCVVRPHVITLRTRRWKAQRNKREASTFQTERRSSGCPCSCSSYP